MRRGGGEQEDEGKSVEKAWRNCKNDREKNGGLKEEKKPRGGGIKRRRETKLVEREEEVQNEGKAKQNTAKSQKKSK